MRALTIIFLLFPVLAIAQLDFETYRGKLNFVELPLVNDVLEVPQRFATKKKDLKRFPSYRLNRQNYREPVGMVDALMATETYKSDLEISINPREYGIYGNSSYAPDGASKVKNEAYKEASRGFYVSDSCPPFGICPRCAPYRVGRFY